jgi:hypothetical protein
MSNIRFISIPTHEVSAYQAGAADAYGQIPEVHLSNGDGIPCRHCQQDVAAGERYLILAYCPFPEQQPYAETGPIFLHAEPCAAYADNRRTPPMVLKRDSYLLKGYNAANRIIYGTGQIVKPENIAGTAAMLLERQDVAYIHVRSALNNCFSVRIDRADGD